MLILLAILITLLIPLVVLGLSFSRLQSGYLWLLVTISTIIAWGIVLISRGQIPISIPLANWNPEFLFSASPMLLVDNVSWPFAVAVMTLALAALLTDISRVSELDPQTWASIQALSGVGLIAVISGNPLTMLMAWAVLDIVESVVQLLRVAGSSEREQVVITFSVRIAGMLLLILAMLRASGLGTPLTFSNIPVEVGGYLLLAAGLRLGVLLPNQPIFREPLMRRSLGTLIRFAPSAASVVLIVRAAHVEISGIWQITFIILATLSVLLSAIAWIRAENEIQSLPYWILGFSAFALAAAALGLPVASSVWGLAMLFSGALLILFSTRHSWLLFLPALGVVGFSTLPLTPSWEGSVLFYALPWWSRVVFYISLALMFVGYIRFARQPGQNGEEIERWMWLIYPIGLTLLPLTYYGLIYTKWILGFREISFQIPGWWSGLIPLGLAAIFMVLFRRIPFEFSPYPNLLSNVFEWIYQILWWGYRSFSRALYVVTRLLEGEGSVLWALLILILLIVTIIIRGSVDEFELK